MNVNEDLVGKTITGVIASHSQANDLCEIWVLQFADGSHVEFVSPGARKALRHAANESRGQSRRQSHGQGQKVRAQNRVQASQRAAAHPVKVPGKLSNSHSMLYQQDFETGAQLTLNVA